MKQFTAAMSVFAALLISAPTSAQEIQNQLAACAGIKNPLERLVCFDNVVAGSAIAPSSNASATSNAYNANVTNQQQGNGAAQFGREHLSDEANGNDERPEKIYIEIVKHSKTGFGYLQIETSDGQVWQQVSAQRFTIDPSAEYFIERGIMKSYYLGRDDQNRRTQVKRIK